MQHTTLHPQLDASEIDRLDRLTDIVNRTRLALGVPAARRIWPLLGLPDLRTSEPSKGPTNGELAFRFEGGVVRTVTIEGVTWFVGKDVTTRLGYANTNDAMTRHCKGVVKRYPLSTQGGSQEVRVLSEADVLRLIVASKLPDAERFERWVFEIVLPEVRRTGQFAGSASGVRGRPKLRTSPGKQGESGFTAPVKEWVARFLNECCDIDAQSEIRAFDFREAFRQWAISEGAPVPIPSAFGRYVINLGVRKRKSGGNIYVGLRLKPAFDPKRRLL